MLTQKELVGLYHELRDAKVLSVYINGEGGDPAQRHVWRRRFEQHVSELRESVKDAPPGEREDFERALGLVESELRSFDAFLPGRGWVGFATPARLWTGEGLASTLPDLVRWEHGIRVAPYLRALKQDRPVVALVVDSRRARVFRFRGGEIHEVADLRADTFLGDLSDAGSAKRATTSSGMRGLTASDAARRLLDVGFERMTKELSEVVTGLAGGEGVVVVGGPQEAVAGVTQSFPKSLADRVLEQPSMHMDQTPAEVKEACRDAASVLRQRQQSHLLDEVVDLARSGGRGTLGKVETLRALQERRVDTLLLSRSFIQTHPDLADHLVGAAFQQGAEAEELSDGGAERLDEEGEGIAARLRYTIPYPAEAAVGSAAG